MSKQIKQRLLDRFLVNDSIGGSDTSEDAQSVQVMETVSTMLDKTTLNARKRKIIWPDGQKLSINQSVKRIHDQHPAFPLELIETNVIDWLLQVIPSPNYSEKQLDELDRFMQKWIETHER